jgi:hypothetical protein
VAGLIWALVMQAFVMWEAVTWEAVIAISKSKIDLMKNGRSTTTDDRPALNF